MALNQILRQVAGGRFSRCRGHAADIALIKRLDTHGSMHMAVGAHGTSLDTHLFFS
jgi:hypothetical protein